MGEYHVPVAGRRAAWRIEGTHSQVRRPARGARAMSTDQWILLAVLCVVYWVGRSWFDARAERDRLREKIRELRLREARAKDSVKP